jgi:ElaB/YqjD/DUF883 family membrane-anchored ribosome-binding protein
MANTNTFEPTGFNARTSVEEKARTAAEGAADTAHAAKEKLGEWTEAAKDTVKDMAASTGQVANQAKDKFMEWSASAAETAEHVAQDAGKELTALIRRHPIESLLAGVAFGFLLAKVLSSRSA